jgi:segregation and condensation protein B
LIWQVSKTQKRSAQKKADITTDDSSASVTESVSSSLAAFTDSGLNDEGASAQTEEIQWTLDGSEIAEELGEPKEHEIFEAAQEDEQLELGDESEMSEAEARLADAELGPAEFIHEDHAVSIIESLLFTSQRPVSVSTIKQIFKGSNIRAKDITRILDELASEFAGSRRGVTLEEVNGGYQLRTKVDNNEHLRRLNKSRPFKLSGPALETLSIIAYKQPVTKHEVDEIRGVESGHLVRALMERGIVNFAGKSELPGKPMLYQTTRKFLEIFGLRNIKELPTLSEIDELLPEGIGDEPEVEKPRLADITGDLAEQVGMSYSEGEEELQKITDSLAAVDTSSEFFEQEKQRQKMKRDEERAANIREAIAVGELVENKDRKWLERFEAKANAPAAAEATATDAEATAGDDGAFATEVESLAETLQTDNRVATEGEEEDLEESASFMDDGDLDDLGDLSDLDGDIDGDPEANA